MTDPDQTPPSRAGPKTSDVARMAGLSTSTVSRALASADALDLIGQWVQHPRADGRLPLIGVSGCQGSGKTTLCRAAAARFGAAHFSLDDVYRTKAEREALGRDIHPLCRVRGAPGSHDLALADQVIAALGHAGPDSRTPIPAFDKLADDRLPQSLWQVFEGKPSAVLIDGWCLGAAPLPPASLGQPVNSLEALEDPAGHWRQWWSANLAGPYQDWLARFDHVLFLAAPSFHVVLDWRCEQEAGLLGIAPHALAPERRTDIAAFIASYQRLTEHMLAGGIRAEAVQALDQNRRALGPVKPTGR